MCVGQNSSVHLECVCQEESHERVFSWAKPTSSAANDTSPTEFYQLRKSGDDVKVEFDGRGVAVSSDMAVELEREVKDEGAVSLEVAIDAQARYRFKSIKIRKKPRIRCWLRIPVKAERRRGGVGGVLASGDRCSVKY